MRTRLLGFRSQRYVKDTLMRFLIASYLMGASVGVAPGPNLVPILEPFMSQDHAALLGTAILFLLAYSMMAGILLRLTILLLAIVLVGSSFMENFIYASEPALGEIWRDVVILCALLQSLTLLTNWQLRKSAMLRRKVNVRRIGSGRRRAPQMGQSYARMLRGYPLQDQPEPDIAPPIRREPEEVTPTLPPAAPAGQEEPEIKNIFA